MATKVRANNLVIVSDLHCGCQLGLCPPKTPVLDEGGEYRASKLQRKVWRWWLSFWNEWVPMACHNEPFAVLVNGDTMDGNHHNSVTQITHNLKDQAAITRRALEPVVELCEGRFYMVRGTEAHVGPSAQEEEALARSLGAIPDSEGRAARYELWARVGKGLVHALHHVGVSGASHYESTAIMKELSESYAEAGRWSKAPPDVVVRSHRHRHLEVRVPTALGYGISFCTAGWQLKTPLTYRIAGGRVTTPQIGGSLVRQGDEDLYTRHKTWGVGRPKEERI